MTPRVLATMEWTAIIALGVIAWIEHDAVLGGMTAFLVGEKHGQWRAEALKG